MGGDPDSSHLCLVKSTNPLLAIALAKTFGQIDKLLPRVDADLPIDALQVTIEAAQAKEKPK